MTDDPGSIEIDRSGTEPAITVRHPPGPFTVTQLRLYGEYLITVAAEAARPAPEPEVDALVAVLGATEARWLPYEEAIRILARAVLAAGYRPEPAAGQDALQAELESRRSDPEFAERIRTRVEADREILRRLEEPEAG